MLQDHTTKGFTCCADAILQCVRHDNSMTSVKPCIKAVVHVRSYDFLGRLLSNNMLIIQTGFSPIVVHVLLLVA